MVREAPEAHTRDVLSRRLRAVFGSRPLDRPGGRRAAVAVVVGEDHGCLGFLLIRRAARLSAHAGQYALPGGRVDAGETVLEAALREVREELALDLGPESIVGRLPDYETDSGYCIAPVVAWADDCSGVRPNPDEVAEAYHIPLGALDGPGVPTLLRTAGSGKPIIQLPLGGDRLIHAPTGAILYQFAAAVLREHYVDVREFGEPEWAR